MNTSIKRRTRPIRVKFAGMYRRISYFLAFYFTILSIKNVTRIALTEQIVNSAKSTSKRV